MKMVISEYWEKVDRTNIPDGQFGIVLKGDYERKSMYIYNDSGWSSLYDFYCDRCLNKPKYLGFDPEEGFKFDLGKGYGIHSYQVVKLIP